VRYGVMHRNTFINSPKLLDNTYAMREKPDVFFAGQITGVEGYVESAASGLMAGINASNRQLGKKPVVLPSTTVIGSMAAYISDSSVRNFQPMNANFGLVDTVEIKTRDKKQKYLEVANKSIEIIKNLSK
jgi:methylenetetrahydrofolate--tRNA-(uracil-5-)-methyltransferase